MASFCDVAEDWQRLDWRLLRDGCVTLYGKREVLEQDVRWLRANEYRVVLFHCDHWTSEDVMHEQMKKQLHFPEHSGKNLDALNDSITDIEVPDLGGCALVLYRFDYYAHGAGALVREGSKETRAETLLGVLASASRYFLLTGRRLLTLVQTDNPNLQFGTQRLAIAIWNEQERREALRAR